MHLRVPFYKSIPGQLTQQLSDFDHDAAAGAKQAGLSVSQMNPFSSAIIATESGPKERKLSTERHVWRKRPRWCQRFTDHTGQTGGRPEETSTSSD